MALEIKGYFAADLIYLNEINLKPQGKTMLVFEIRIVVKTILTVTNV
jgi:hypothetical protein